MMTEPDATPPSSMAGFERRLIPTDQGSISIREGGSGSAVLLLHGFPETSLMWREVAPLLAPHFKVIAADLPGYGLSDCPETTDDHTAMSKRAMAATLVAVMRQLGHKRFAVVGHDRGGRVAYRAALDHPGTVAAIAVLDVVPTLEVWERADARLALSFWPFSLLAQPAPLPERLLAAAPEAVIDNAFAEWGSPPEVFPPWLRGHYADMLRDPARVHAICEEYRAAASIDREADRSDLAAGRRIVCPLLALWSNGGPLDRWYEDVGGPLGLWRRWAADARGQAVEGGHFFPEESPEGTADLLREFLTAVPRFAKTRRLTSKAKPIPPA